MLSGGGATCWILWWRRCGANSDRVAYRPASNAAAAAAAAAVPGPARRRRAVASASLPPASALELYSASCLPLPYSSARRPGRRHTACRSARRAAGMIVWLVPTGRAPCPPLYAALQIDRVLSRPIAVCHRVHTIRYTRCYFNVLRSKADTSQLNLPHGINN